MEINPSIDPMTGESRMWKSRRIAGLSPRSATAPVPLHDPRQPRSLRSFADNFPILAHYESHQKWMPLSILDN
jgi:hypothetical protein